MTDRNKLSKWTSPGITDKRQRVIAPNGGTSPPAGTPPDPTPGHRTHWLPRGQRLVKGNFTEPSQPTQSTALHCPLERNVHPGDCHQEQCPSQGIHSYHLRLPCLQGHPTHLTVPPHGFPTGLETSNPYTLTFPRISCFATILRLGTEFKTADLSSANL